MATVHSMEGLKRVQTKAGGRWYDLRTGKFVRLEIKRRDPFEDRFSTLTLNGTSFHIELDKKKVKIKIDERNEKTKRIEKTFETEVDSLKAFQGIIADKIKNGYREWTFKKKKKRRRGPSARIADIMRSRKRLPTNADKPMDDVVVPTGYVEIKKGLVNSIDSAIGHASEFVKLSKASIKDIRKVSKAKKYQNLEYRIAVATDSFEDKILAYAKWARKKNNLLSRYTKPGTSHSTYIVKRSNFIVILNIFREILEGLGNVLKYQMVLKPRKKPTIRFFDEGKKIWKNGADIIDRFEALYPQIHEYMIA